MASSNDRIVLGPEKAVYRGTTGSYSQVSGNGTIILTAQRLIFQKRTGGVVEVPTSKIIGTRQSASFRSSRVAGSTHLIVITSDPAQLGFFVGDLAAWEQAIATVIPT